MTGTGDALVVIGAPAIITERVVNSLFALILPDIEAGHEPSRVYKRIRSLIGMAMVFSVWILFAFLFNLNLIKPIFLDLDITANPGKWLTAMYG